MARGKNSTKTVKKDGNHRRETKEEKALRLKSQMEAREACQKILPYCLGAVVLFLILFAIYASSVPPRVVPTPVPMETSVPPTMEADTISVMETSNVDGPTTTTSPLPDDADVVEL